MKIAGPCLYVDALDTDDIIRCAAELQGVVDIFRVKIYGGGTSPEKYMRGIGDLGLDILQEINDSIIPVITEIHTPEQLWACVDLHGIWIGARNSANYSLLEQLKYYHGEIFIKRGTGMSLKEFIGLYDICHIVHNFKPYVIERGVNYLSRTDKTW